MQLGRQLIILFALQFSSVHALDLVNLPIRDTATKAYQIALIKEALIQSEDLYGSYKLQLNLAELSSKRSFKELKEGNENLINVRVALTSQNREESAIPIRLPIRKGLLSYKVLIINKADVNLFNDVKCLDDLKAHKFGVVYDWLTAEIMHNNAFDVTSAPSFHGLFRMLNAGRFDYTILGVNEAYSIMESLKDKNLNLMIAPNIALYVNTPSYIFVSNNNPRLAERLTWGLEKMVENGRFDALFNQYHQPYLDQANLKARTLITVPNPELALMESPPPYSRKELWFDPIN